MSFEEEKSDIKKQELNKLNNSINQKESLITNDDSLNNSNFMFLDCSSLTSLDLYILILIMLII